NSLTFDAQRSTQGSQVIAVRSSLDIYAVTLSTLSPGNNSFTSNLTISFPAPTFQNLTNPITFRIYGYNAGATAGTLRLDNVSLNGSAEIVPVPFGFAPGWGIVASGIGMGLRKLKNKKDGCDRIKA
ncbi:MAG TPA: hypothetical protein VL134_13805, partial [Leptolyngbya sp.]|nr:hypothetical protein [Leptolyngbya sp.]